MLKRLFLQSKTQPCRRNETTAKRAGCRCSFQCFFLSFESSASSMISFFLLIFVVIRWPKKKIGIIGAKQRLCMYEVESLSLKRNTHFNLKAVSLYTSDSCFFLLISTAGTRFHQSYLVYLASLRYNCANFSTKCINELCKFFIWLAENMRFIFSCELFDKFKCVISICECVCVTSQRSAKHIYFSDMDR